MFRTRGGLHIDRWKDYRLGLQDDRGSSTPCRVRRTCRARGAFSRSCLARTGAGCTQALKGLPMSSGSQQQNGASTPTGDTCPRSED
eukprot:scaffold86693_cov60-Phaeocystis_antarctica.AAC.2